MRYVFLVMLAMVLAVGCSQSVQSVTYEGPQSWPTGRASISHTALNEARIIYGLPERPYEVVRIVEIPRQAEIPDRELAALSDGLDYSRPDALVLIGTRYDRLLEVDRHLAEAGNVAPDCMKVIEKIRKINRDDPRRLVFLAIRWKGGESEPTQVVRSGK